MKYRFRWSDPQIITVLNRINDDRKSLTRRELFNRELSAAEEKILRWTPNSITDEITTFIQTVCTDRYIGTLRTLIRSKTFSGKIDSSATTRLSSTALTRLNILTGLDECKNLSRSEIIERALDQFWDEIIQNSVVTTDNDNI